MKNIKFLLILVAIPALLFSLTACNQHKDSTENPGLTGNPLASLEENVQPISPEELQRLMPPGFFFDPDGDGSISTNTLWLDAQSHPASIRKLSSMRASVGSGKKILFYTRLNNQWLSFTSDLRQVLSDMGYTVEVANSDDLLPDLSTVDVLVIIGGIGTPFSSPNDRPMPFSDKTKIQNFVSSGKGFFFTGDWNKSELPKYNDISAIFGVTMDLQKIDYIVTGRPPVTYYVPEWYAYVFDYINYYSINPSQPILKKELLYGYSCFSNATHEIFKDVNSVLVMGSSFVRPRVSALAAVRTHPTTSRLRDYPIVPEGYPIVLANEYGSGRYVISCDSNAFANDGLATSILAGTDNTQFAKNILNWLAKTSSAPEITSIEFRYDGDSTNLPSNLELSSLKDIKNFKAIGFSGVTELPQVKVNWTLENGDVAVDQVLRNGILTTLNSNVGKIGVFSTPTGTASTLLDSETARFVTFLSGNISLVASASNGVSKAISIRIKQPTIYLDFKELDTVGAIPILPDWETLASQTWNSENLIAVKFRTAGLTTVNNQTFNPALSPIESLETALVFLGVPLPDLLNVIVFDYQADSHYGHSITQTRQLSELGNCNRSTTNTDINIYITKRLYYNSGLWDFPGGWTSSSDEHYRRDMTATKIDDSSESSIALINPNYDSPGVFGLYKRSYLAHEIGHVLMQYGDEHYWEGLPLPTTNLMSKAPAGIELTPGQFIYALGFNKSIPNRFLVEE